MLARCLGQVPTLRRLLSGRFKSPVVHTATTNVQRRRDVGHRASGLEEFHSLISFEPRGRPPPRVAILSLRLCDALALTLKQKGEDCVLVSAPPSNPLA